LVSENRRLIDGRPVRDPAHQANAFRFASSPQLRSIS
jgi:hypothetical protein